MEINEPYINSVCSNYLSKAALIMVVICTIKVVIIGRNYLT